MLPEKNWRVVKLALIKKAETNNIERNYIILFTIFYED
jgi:hypothetical protein